MDLLSYWQLSEKPFEDLRDPRFFYESSEHREALDRLLYIVHDRNMGIGLLTGEIGSGKTITRKVLERCLARHEYEVVSLDQSNLPFTDILYSMIREIRFERIAYEMSGISLEGLRGDKFALLEVLQKFARHLNEVEKRHLVFIFDEAQELEADAIENIKNLTHLGTDARNYLTLLLVGQPELRQTIKELRQLDQRVSLRFHLNNLDLANTEKYIHHRLRVAGCAREDIFTDEAVAVIFKGTGGVPREINRVCKLSLDHGFSAEAKEIGREIVQLILEDLERQR